MRQRLNVLMVLVIVALMAATPATGWGQQPAPNPQPAPAVQPVSSPIPHLGLVTPDPTGYAQAKTVGMRTVKIIADWSLLEPQRGQFAWTDLDRVIGAAAREGLVPIVVLAYTAKWASLGAGTDLARPEVYSRQPPRDVRDWERFVGAVAERYRGRVAHWQIWTQIGLPAFRGTGQEYFALVQAARARLRAVDPASKVALAAPNGLDPLYVSRMAQEAPALFDAVALSPVGFSPEALLRPLALMGHRLRVQGKAIWLEWLPDGSASRIAQWTRLLAVAQATGVERVDVLDPSHMPDVRMASATVLAQAYAGYLQRGPEVYAVVFGSGSEATLVAWTTSEGRMLEVAGTSARVTALDGSPAQPEIRDGKTLIRLGGTPLAVAGMPPSVAEEARAAASRGPLLPPVPAERDYSKVLEVSAQMARANVERGLYNMPYRARPNGAVDAVEIQGSTAVMTSVARGAWYLYFDVDDTFVYFAEGRTTLEIVVEVLGASAPNQLGFNLLYDSVTGYRFSPWQWVEAREGWVRYTVRLTDANFANTWGWDFAINAAGNQRENLTVRSVSVRKAQ